LEGDFLVISGQKFPRKTKTPYKSKKDAWLELDQIWFLLANQNLNLGAYTLEAQKTGVQTISLPERKALISYMTGEAATSPLLDVAMFALSNVEQKDADSEQRGTKRSFDDSTASFSSSESKLPSASSEWTVDDIVAQESTVTSRLSLLQTKQGSFAELLANYDRIQKDDLKAAAHPGSKKSGDKRHRPDEKHRPPSKDGAIPIIIVPAALSSLLTLHNATEFFEKGVFVPSRDKQAQNPKKPDVVKISRFQRGDKSKSCVYHIIDNIAMLRHREDWERVVAVFATGAKWQFEKYPWKTPAQIFDNICAFHVHFDDEPLNENIKEWKINKLSISKNKRYQDRSVVMDFWQLVTDFIASHPVKKKRLIF